LAIRRHLGTEPEAFLDSLAKGVSRAVLAMRQDHTRSRLKVRMGQDHGMQILQRAG
jgi:hypothetical protein